MILYRVHWHTEGGTSNGFSWFRTRRAAKAEIKLVIDRDALTETDLPELERVEVAVSAEGVFAALHVYASHADNG